MVIFYFVLLLFTYFPISAVPAVTDAVISCNLEHSGHEAGIHPGLDTSLYQGFMHTHSIIPQNDFGEREETRGHSDGQTGGTCEPELRIEFSLPCVFINVCVYSVVNVVYFLTILTYIVVFSAWSELEAQWKWGEELKLLRELERPVGRVGPIALPAFEPRRRVVTGAVAVVVDHVQHVALGPFLWHGVHVVGTVDVQVVVDAHVKVVVTSIKSVNKGHTFKIYIHKYVSWRNLKRVGMLGGDMNPILTTGTLKLWGF